MINLGKLLIWTMLAAVGSFACVGLLASSVQATDTNINVTVARPSSVEAESSEVNTTNFNYRFYVTTDNGARVRVMLNGVVIFDQNIAHSQEIGLLLQDLIVGDNTLEIILNDNLTGVETKHEVSIVVAPANLPLPEILLPNTGYVVMGDYVVGNSSLYLIGIFVLIDTYVVF